MKIPNVIGFVLLVVLVATPLSALENDGPRRDHLKRLRGAINAYAMLNPGKVPEKLSALVDESLLDGPASLLRPGSKEVVPPRAELDARSDYTVEALAGVKDMVVREKAPLPGETEVLAIFKDGSIRALAVAATSASSTASPPTPPTVAPPVTPRPTTPAVIPPTKSTGAATMPPHPPPVVSPEIPAPPATRPASSATVATLPTDATGSVTTITFPPDDSPVVAIPPKTPSTVRTPPVPPLGRPPATSSTPVPDDLTAARAALAEGRVAEARTAFAAAAQRDPQSAEAALGLGDSASLAGDLGVAMSSYLNVARLAPDTPNLQVAIAEVFLARGNARSARQWLETEVKLRPGSALAWSWLGTVQHDGGELEQASASMKRAASLDREVTALRFKHGVALLSQNQAKRAAAEFTAALLLDPRGTGAHYYLAECQARLGERAKAIESFGRYLQADATSDWATKARQRIEELRRNL
ncbi:MAG: tetratricopeptide repeat protein [Opitutaceae bacterium]|nr:tetratricopeptide repeat protein [Opitutaceae bacterium]